MIINATDNNFEEVTSEGVVLIDFWAPWCGPCRMQAPALEEFAQEYEGQVEVVKLDVDENPATAAQFAVMSIPTLLVKKDGQVVKKVAGFHSKDLLKELMAPYIEQ